MAPLHTYADAAGAPIYWRIRLKHPGTGAKWIRPMKLEAGRYVVGEPAFPNGKPLYRLDELARRPGEPVFVVEGETCADALLARGVLATTSGAADSAGKANWAPLAGRDVTIWPDNDEPGARLADEATARLTPLGCRVRRVDVGRLALPAKGDCVDWLEVHPNATRADLLALACVEDGGAAAGRAAEVPTPCRAQGGRFTVTTEGVFFARDDDDEVPARRVCGELRVLAKNRDRKSEKWGWLLEWPDADGVRHRWSVPAEMLEGDGAELRRELARRGLTIESSQRSRDLLPTYIKAWPTADRARCVDRLGWHGDLFVTPSEAIGDAGELVTFQAEQALEPTWAVSGGASDWRTAVACLAAGNSRLVFAVSAAFAGTLADMAGVQGGGFHLFGKSSTGKSTALNVAGSVWGRPDGYRRTWRATGNGLEGVAGLHNDGLLILDELSESDPRETGEAVYMLANGQGKTRANRSGGARESARWRLLFLSAGEVPLAAHMGQAGKRPNAGQEIRFADFNADAGAGMGVLEALNGHATPAALVRAISDATARFHGAVGLEWLRRVVADRPQLPDVVSESIRRFVGAAVSAGAAGQVERVARRFALVATAGEQATRYGLTGWEEGEAERAAKACFLAWLDGFGGVGNREERATLSQVRAFFETHGASRFEALDSHDDQRVFNRAGFVRRGEGGAREFLVLPEAFRREVCAGLDAKATEALLQRCGWLEAGGDGRPTQKIRLPGMCPSRVYVFGGKLWESDDP
jgi:uncharacterized protein (DUF927 family)